APGVPPTPSCRIALLLSRAPVERATLRRQPASRPEPPRPPRRAPAGRPAARAAPAGTPWPPGAAGRLLRAPPWPTSSCGRTPQQPHTAPLGCEGGHLLA